MSETLTHWKLLQDPNYIGAYSLQPNEERTIQIERVVKEFVTGPDGKKEECTVAYLKGEKPFILNVTNCKTLAKLYGTPYIEYWRGKSCVIYAAKVKAFGEEVEALRIKNTLPALPELTQSHSKWKDVVKALANGKATIEQIESRFRLSESIREELIASAL